MLTYNPPPPIPPIFKKLSNRSFAADEGILNIPPYSLFERTETVIYKPGYTISMIIAQKSNIQKKAMAFTMTSIKRIYPTPLFHLNFKQNQTSLNFKSCKEN
ncbi:hypothetical protein PEDI_41230 [Persicobacter diffluens]|uniref:Uncharacterized protein n=1 Tax=Persicobacter diffluens TaxID=981 RepID=A0AAN4W2M6_9BACT|nr:hypothetical protein PEDI_41230 [Persicobacter diffluens]